MFKKMIMMLALVLVLFGCSQSAPTDLPVTKDPITEVSPAEPVEPDPTCSDNIKNQGEDMVDCGGPCSACPTCSDGKLNQGEEKIDCGGPCDACALPRNNDAIVDELIGKHSKFENGYSYDFSFTDDSLENQPGTIERVSVSGDNVGINYFVMQTYNGFNYNYLYIDRSKNEAYIYCEDTSCKQMNGTAKSVSFNNFDFKTPTDFMDSLLNAKYVNDQTYNSKESVVLSEETDDYTAKLWVWEFYGVPQKIERTYAGKTLEERYENYMFNKVTLEDVTLPSAAVIV